MISPSSSPLWEARSGLWLSLLVAASLMCDSVFACATPFAALATFAAVTLSRRNAVLAVLAVWFANQLMGYLLLDYPQTTSSFTWGAIIGTGALASVFAARAALAKFSTAAFAVRVGVAFAAAAAAYQFAMFLPVFTPLSGADDFTFAIVGRVLAINALALAGLLALGRVAIAFGFAAPAKSIA